MVKLVGTEVGALGYGLMGLTWRAKPVSTEDAIETMHAALNLGGKFWNGGEFYGPPEANSLQLLNAYFTKYPEDADKVVLSIKGGADPKTMHPTGDEKGVRRSVDQCLHLLDGKKRLDLFECARVDPNTPIEETMRVLNEYVKEGKLGGICLSETAAATIRRAAKVAKIEGVEVEFSLFSTDILENGVAAACKDLGIPVIAYSPLCRGFLTGDIHSRDDIADDNMIKNYPRFSAENFETNMELVREVEKLAKKKGVANTQVALAWIRYQSGKGDMPEIIPIPGSTTVPRTKENLADVTLTDEEYKELNDALKNCTVAGARYPPHVEAMSFR